MVLEKLSKQTELVLYCSLKYPPTVTVNHWLWQREVLQRGYAIRTDHQNSANAIGSTMPVQNAPDMHNMLELGQQIRNKQVKQT